MGIRGVDDWKTWNDAFSYQTAYEVTTTVVCSLSFMCFTCRLPCVGSVVYHVVVHSSWTSMRIILHTVENSTL